MSASGLSKFPARNLGQILICILALAPSAFPDPDPAVLTEYKASLCIRDNLASTLKTRTPGTREYNRSQARLERLNANISDRARSMGIKDPKPEPKPEPEPPPRDTPNTNAKKTPDGFRDIDQLKITNLGITIQSGSRYYDNLFSKAYRMDALFWNGQLGMTRSTTGELHDLRFVYFEIPELSLKGSDRVVKPGTLVLTNTDSFTEHKVGRVSGIFQKTDDLTIIELYEGGIRKHSDMIYYEVEKIVDPDLTLIVAKDRKFLTEDGKLKRIQGVFVNEAGQYRITAGDGISYPKGSIALEVEEAGKIKAGTSITFKDGSQDTVESVCFDGKQVKVALRSGKILPLSAIKQ